MKALTPLPGEGWGVATELGNGIDATRDLALALNAAGEARMGARSRCG